MVVNVRSQELEECRCHLDENERKRDYPRQSVKSIRTMYNFVQRFIASDEVGDLSDLFAFELSFQMQPFLRQRMVRLVQVTANLLDVLTHRCLLALSVLKGG